MSALNTMRVKIMIAYCIIEYYCKYGGLPEISRSFCFLGKSTDMSVVFIRWS